MNDKSHKHTLGKNHAVPPLKSLLLHILVLTLLCSCNSNRLQPVPEDGVILAFGDSLTAGMGAQQSESYPAVLAELSGREVINAGVSGETTAEGLKRLPRLLARHQPALLILLEGGNDILRNKNLAHTKANLAAMLDLAQGQGIDVVLIGVPGKNLFSSVAPMYAELAEQYHVVFIADLISDQLRNRAYKADHIHFNAAGYRAMAAEIYAVLQQHGALD